MIQVLAPQRKSYPKQSDTLSETSTDSCEPLDHLDRHDFGPRARNGQGSNAKAKSSLCKNFMEKGSCPYGSKCQFAHGPAELKCNSDHHMSYKTRPCHAFARKGFCTYGQRCNFLHLSDPSEPALEIQEGYKEVFYGARNGGSRLLSLLGSQ